MKLRSVLAGLIALLCLNVPLHAAEPYLEFLEGLRERDYFDYAIIYLDQIVARADTPAEIKEVIPFEKAITLLQGVRTVRSPEQQSKQLDDAKLFLEQFLKASPRHAKAAQANTELANVLVGKGRVEVLQSRSPNNAAQKGDYQKKARDYYAQARKVFQAAHDQYKTAYEKFNAFIDKAKNKSDYETREQSLVNYIQAQLNLGIVTYEEAQTYDKTAKEYKQFLTKASTEFEAIHSKYRSQIAGLYARMWQGKCFEEQDDLNKALGIYNELLGHGSAEGGKVTGPLKTLQDRVLHFKLICLNHDQKKDYQVVVQDATEWLKENTGNARQTRVGLGIQWEMARAQEMMAKKEGTVNAERDRLNNQALATARIVNRYPGEYKEASSAAIQRLLISLNREPGDPKDFETAFGVGRDMVQQITKRTAAIDGIKNPNEKNKQIADLQLQLKEASRILNLALTLAGPKDAVKEINTARYMLSYVYYLMKKSYESAILGEFIATRYHATEPDQALDAAFLSMAAYMQAYNALPDGQRDLEIQRMIDTCNFITQHWPKSDKAHEARMYLGSIYSQIKQPAEAAKWFLQVPESATQYLDAQLKAGQAYWQAYVESTVLPEEQRPPKEQLEEWLKQAQKILRDGITKREANLAEGAPPVDNITAAKYSLVQILNGSGAYKDALVLLTEGGRSLASAVAVADKEQRPPTGAVKSVAFASAVYRELLRAYVGIQDLDKARASMKELEKIAGAGGGGAGITPILLQLGKELEKEVKRLQSANDSRLSDVLKSFETFLDDMFKRQDGQDYNTLSWIGETYYALGEGMEQGDKAKSEAYFAKAGAAFQAIVEKASKDEKFAPEGNVTAVKLRLVNCKRRQNAFDDAHKLIVEILKVRNNTLDGQREAALVYQDWGARGGPEHWEKWNLAITGDKKTIWGWQDFAERLGRNLMQGGETSEYEPQYLDARYNLAFSRFRYAMAQTNSQKKGPLLEAAMRDVTVTASLSEDLGGGESWDKFNQLYRSIQQKMLDEGHAAMKGKQVADLEKRIKVDPADLVAAAAEKKKAEATTVATSKKTKAAKAAPAKPASSGGSGMIIGLLVIVVAGGGAAAYYFTSIKGKKKKPRKQLQLAEATPVAAPPAAPVKKKPTKPKS